MESPCTGAAFAFSEAPWWIKTTVPGVMDQYRRPALKGHSRLSNQLSGFAKITFGRGHAIGTDNATVLPINIYTKDTNGDEPDSDQEYHLVIEIMHSEAHCTPWARLPLSGDMSDHSLALRLGMRIEYRKHGQWKSLAFQASLEYQGHSQLQPNRPPMSYLQARAIMRHLQREVLNRSEIWQQDYGLAKIKRVSFDHLDQVLTVESLSLTDSTLIPAPTYDPRFAESTLASLGAMNFNTGWQSFPNGRVTSSYTGQKTGMHKRQTCDRCFMHNRLLIAKKQSAADLGGHGRLGCTPTESMIGQGNCKVCWDFHHQHCSWTPTDTLLEFEEAYVAHALHPKAATQTVYNIGARNALQLPNAVSES